MLHRLTLIYLVLLAQNCWAKTANVKAYGMQFSVTPTQTSEGTTIYITTYDGSSSYPQQDNPSGFISNEFRQESPCSSVFLAYYLAGDLYGIKEYGSISYNISNTDVDGNGVPDWLQKENSVNLSILGSTTLHWLDPSPSWSSANFSLSGTFSRGAAQSRGDYTVYFTSGGYTASASGNWYIRYFEGTIDYDDGSFTLDIQSTDSDGIAFTVSGSSTYSSTSEDSLTLASTQLSGAVGNIVTKASTFQRNGSVYSGSLELVDGEPDTSWVDYEDWYIEIEDPNDADGDSIPDFSDPSIVQVSSGNGALQTSGWSYHAWPWVYSNLVGDWLYYASSSNGVMMVWSNYDKNWYFWNSTNASWQKN